MVTALFAFLREKNKALLTAYCCATSSLFNATTILFAAEISVSWQQQPSADRLTHFLRQPADPLAGVNGTGRHLTLHAPAQSIKKVCSKVTVLGDFEQIFAPNRKIQE